MSTAALLDTRGKTHGNFADNARIGQRLRAFFRSQSDWDAMPEVHREALDLIALKLSRILSGQSSHEDHWLDISGYAELARQYRPKSYDDRQIEPPLTNCEKCGKPYYMRNKVCVPCADSQGHPMNAGH